MPTTAFQHFQDDLSRARAIVVLADPLPQGSALERRVRSDLLRSAWMFAVGALDAYFCDAYTDVVAASIISKSRHPVMTLPDFFYNIRFPVRAILEPYAVNINWRWRMAARKMMERETVLSLSTVQSLFNKFFRDAHKFFGDLLDNWIVHPEATKRMFGITGLAYSALSPANKDAARRDAQREMQDRYADIFQRRHDCIHNCDRPKVSPQPLGVSKTVLNVIEDVEFLVARCNEHINSEFRQFLLDNHCPAAVVAQAGY
jgi:hypothetical protein